MVGWLYSFATNFIVVSFDKVKFITAVSRFKSIVFGIGTSVVKIVIP